jgi:hypothetical protein
MELLVFILVVIMASLLLLSLFRLVFLDDLAVECGVFIEGTPVADDGVEEVVLEGGAEFAFFFLREAEGLREEHLADHTIGEVRRHLAYVYLVTDQGFLTLTQRLLKLIRHVKVFLVILLRLHYEVVLGHEVFDGLSELGLFAGDFLDLLALELELVDAVDVVLERGAGLEQRGPEHLLETLPNDALGFPVELLEVTREGLLRP